MDPEAITALAKEIDRAEAVAKPQKVESKASMLTAKDPVKPKVKYHSHKKEKKRKSNKRMAKKQKRAQESDSESTSETEDTDSSGDSSSESDQQARRRGTKRSAKSGGTKRRQKSVADESGSATADDTQPVKSRKRRGHHGRQESDVDSGGDERGTSGVEDNMENLKLQLEALKLEMEAIQASRDSTKHVKHKKSKTTKSSTYKRVDQLWDSTIHNFKLKETTKDDDSEFAEYAFTVRRRFDFEGQYLFTVVDIKNPLLKQALAEVMKESKTISLDAEEPTIDPNLLFLYVEQIRTYYRKTLKSEIKKERKKKAIQRLESQRALCKMLVEYIDEDYAEIKKTLYPLIEAGNITFELAWALFKPGEIIVTSTYGQWDEPRCFKVEYAHKQATVSRGEFYSLEGRYIENDGKTFGLGDFELDIDAFKGTRKISSLPAYPLKYHRDETAVRKQILERGRRFVEYKGMNYRVHKGLAFMKKKKQVLKININGRVMVDPATFRRINANYPVSMLKSKDSEDLFSDDSSSSSDCSCCSSGDDDEKNNNNGEKLQQRGDDNDGSKVKYELVRNDIGDYVKVAVEVDEDGNRLRPQKVEQLEVQQSFTDEELLLTSSVVLGFAFSEKLWLEFTLSGLSDIQYNEAAFDSLVLPANQKSIVKALVESHKFNAAKTIDDVVQGKGRSLVTVLHGPPGTGKTLTAESIAELLKCPLYMVSAGELGTDPARLEGTLNQILDIAHTWGALLLLDEADVFLERREANDVHRNALVSVFLRLLEYFQGILFLTTNRVETFDDAFSSRIHLALKYGELTVKAKNQVWRMFFEMCKKQDGCPVADLTDHDFDMLARRQLNGRQIKNIVRTAQALALNEKETLGLSQVRRVMDVAESFDRELKGGSGYLDAMRSYT